MKLIYAHDVQWNDLEKIENPFFAGSTVKQELNRPLSTLSGGFGSAQNPLNQIRKRGRRETNNDASRQFYKDIELGKILLVHDFEVPPQRRAYQPSSDNKQPDKKRWELKEGMGSTSARNLEEILLRVKKPQSPGPIVARKPAFAAVGANTLQTQKPGTTVDPSYLLRFKLLDKNGQPIANLPYKTVKTGTSAEPLHIADAKTPANGLTTTVSNTQGEEIDFYIVWAKLTVDKSFIKM